MVKHAFSVLLSINKVPPEALRVKKSVNKRLNQVKKCFMRVKWLPVSLLKVLIICVEAEGTIVIMRDVSK